MIVNVHDAKTQFSKLLERAHSGAQFTLAKANKPYARLTPLVPTCSACKPGRTAEIDDPRIPDPLPETELAAWNGK